MPQLQQSGCSTGDAEMITAELTRITTALTLTPKDFKAQLYAALVDTGHRFLLPRVCGIAIFDRHDGGEPLDSAPFNQGPLSVWPGDEILCHMGWPG
jgi:hypothetical protein